MDSFHLAGLPDRGKDNYEDKDIDKDLSGHCPLKSLSTGQFSPGWSPRDLQIFSTECMPPPPRRNQAGRRVNWGQSQKISRIVSWSCFIVAPVADLHLEVCIVPQQLGHPASKGEDNKEKEEHPLDNVDDHLAKGDLERTQVGVDGEQVGHLLDIS